MSRRLKFAVRIAMSVGLLALAFWYVGDRGVLSTLGNATLVGVLTVIGLHTGDRLLMAYKWRRLLLARDLQIGLGEAIRAYYISSFAGVVLPMTVGADVVRVAALRRGTISTSNLVASIAIERALGALSQAVFCVLSVLLIAAMQLQLEIPAGGLLAMVAVIIVVLTVAMPVSFGLAAELSRRGHDKPGIRGKLASLAHDYAAWRSHPREIWVFLLLTLLEGFFPILTYLAAASALGVPTNLVAMTAIIPLVYLVARIPLIGVAGIGPEQLGFVAAAGLIGIGDANALAMSLLVLTGLLVALLPGAIAWMLARR